MNGYEVHERAVSSGDHSFEAKHDGKYIYCFSNEHWSASSKEVSFNVHGIVYVPESEAPSDPLEAEGAWTRIPSRARGCTDGREMDQRVFEKEEQIADRQIL